MCSQLSSCNLNVLFLLFLLVVRNGQTPCSIQVRGSEIAILTMYSLTHNSIQGILHTRIDCCVTSTHVLQRMTILHSQCGDTTTELYQAAANNPPCQYCDGTPCGPCIELADIETQIEVIHSRLRDLHEKHRAARSKRNHVHNRLIHQLPLEIVSHIFTLCLPPSLGHCLSKSEGFPFTLSGVCCAWRVLALSTPSLWSSSIQAVNINTPVAHINHRLMHSGSLPISLRLYSKIPRRATNTDDSTEVMNLIKKNLYRTDSLCLNLSDEHINKFSSSTGCPSSMPLLQELHVHGRTTPWGSSELKLSTTPPRPQTVYVNSYYANLIDLDWDGVSYLTLQDTTIQCSLVLLSMAKRLVNFTLNIIDREDSQLILSNAPIVHHSIRHLALEEGETANTIFSFSTMTSLDTLSIMDFTEFLPLSPRFVAFLRRSSCPLRCLELGFTDHFPADALIDVLSELPALQELSLFDDYHTETEAIDPLLERLSLTRSSGNGIFLPCLRSFQYAGPVSSYTLFLDIFPPSEGTLTSYPTRALQKVDIEVRANLRLWNWSGPPLLSKGDVQHILHLQNAGKHISITVMYGTKSIDLIKRSMDTYSRGELILDEGG